MDVPRSSAICFWVFFRAFRKDLNSLWSIFNLKSLNWKGHRTQAEIENQIIPKGYPWRQPKDKMAAKPRSCHRIKFPTEKASENRGKRRYQAQKQALLRRQIMLFSDTKVWQSCQMAYIKNKSLQIKETREFAQWDWNESLGFFRWSRFHASLNWAYLLWSGPALGSSVRMDRGIISDGIMKWISSLYCLQRQIKKSKSRTAHLELLIR